MDEEIKDGSEVQETTEEVAEETTQENSETEDNGSLSAEQIADLQRKADASSQNFERAKKAEADLKDAREKLKTAPSDGQLSSSDSISLAAAIAKGTVDEEDIERVQKFAKDEGVSVKEALKSDELKAILSVRVEKRSTAQAANISNVRRGPTKTSDDQLLSNASKGKLPDSDEDIERLIAAKAKKK